MTRLPLPEVMRIGQARLTAGLDRFTQMDLATHRQVFGTLRRLTTSQLIIMADRVDLRGRGGAAFPFARKLRAVAEQTAKRGCRPVVVVNGTECEPGSAKDSMLLLRSPFLVLSGALLAAHALDASEIVVGVPEGGPVGQTVLAAARAEGQLRRLVRITKVPERFVSGEGGALVNSANGNGSLPPGRKRHASDSGVRGVPTLLSNAETFAQLAVLGLLGPDGYASTGTEAEPGTVMLTVGGSAGRPAIVEVPTGVPLGEVLDICEAGTVQAVLVGGYHGKWLSGEAAYEVPVSRAGLEAAGSSLGAGIVLPLNGNTCPLGEAARIARYLAAESSGQCGPCKLGLPAVARALSAIADGSGGVEALDVARRSATAVRGRGACKHPDGTATFVLSALEVFTDDLAAHVFRGGCGKPVLGLLPLPANPAGVRLEVDWTRCDGHGLCGRIVPEVITLDGQGYPSFLDTPVPPWLERDARQAVAMCPALALRLAPAGPVVAPPKRRLAIESGLVR